MADNGRQFHPVAEIFPMMEGQALDELAADIKANGLREEIWTHEDQIIDGRNRYRACEMVDVAPRFREWDGRGSLIDFIMSLNLHRRHLTPSQRAMVAARARGIYDEEAKKRQRAGGGVGGKVAHGKLPVNLPEAKIDSRDAAGKAAGVSGTYVDRATKVLANAVPEVVKAVDEGRMGVTTAAILATEPPDVQRAEASHPKRNRTYNSVSGRVAVAEEPSTSQPQEKESDEQPRVRGVGIVRANEAINSLTRIPKNDALRSRGFQLVTDWIRHNK
jgi:hypothetical protein